MNISSLIDMARVRCWRTARGAALAAAGLLALSPASAAEIKAYLLLGQSFILGHGYSNQLASIGPVTFVDQDLGTGLTLDPLPLQAAQADIQHLNSGGPYNNVEANTLTTLVPMEPRFGRDPDMLGPEVGFGRAMADFHGEPIVTVKRAIGGSSLVNDWAPGEGYAWFGLVDALNNAIADVAADGDTLRFLGAIWVQSNGDANNRKAAQAYGQNLRHFIQELRALVSGLGVGAADLPFIFQEHNGGGRYFDDILNGQYEVIGLIGGNPEPNVSMIPWVEGQLESNEPPVGHWSARGCLQFGLQAALWMQTYLGPTIPTPTVTITAPAEGEAFPSNSQVTFTVTATDEVDGDLSASVSWYLDGAANPWATGASVTYNFSGQDGDHTVEARAVNSQGGTGLDTVSLTVGDPPPVATASVALIEYSTSGGKGGDKNLQVTLWVVDGALAPVAGAAVNIDLLLDGTLDSQASGTTGSDGSVSLQRSNAPAGAYTTVVTGLSAAGSDWDGVTPPNAFTK